MEGDVAVPEEISGDLLAASASAFVLLIECLGGSDGLRIDEI